jgi:hypothetical protein
MEEKVLQIWQVAANILNKQLQTADKGDVQTWGLGRGLTNPYHIKPTCYEMLHRALGFGGFSGTT